MSRLEVCDPVVVVWYPEPVIAVMPPTADQTRRALRRTLTMLPEGITVGR